MAEDLALKDSPKEGEKNRDPRKAKGTFTINTEHYNYYIRNISGISLEEFLAYINNQPLLFSLNSSKVLNKAHIVSIEYSPTYNNTWPTAEI